MREKHHRRLLRLIALAITSLLALSAAGALMAEAVPSGQKDEDPGLTRGPPQERWLDPAGAVSARVSPDSPPRPRAFALVMDELRRPRATFYAGEDILLEIWVENPLASEFVQLAYSSCQYRYEFVFPGGDRLSPSFNCFQAFTEFTYPAESRTLLWTGLWGQQVICEEDPYPVVCPAPRGSYVFEARVPDRPRGIVPPPAVHFDLLSDPTVPTHVGDAAGP